MSIRHSSIGTGNPIRCKRFRQREEDDDIDEYREWQQDRIIKAKEVINSDDYLSLPSKFDMNEYQIIEEFCCSVKNDKIRESLLDKIRGRGAFSRLKMPFV